MNENSTNPIASANIQPPLFSVDLRAEIERLHRENTGPSGRSSKTLVKYPDFRVVLMVMKSNAKFAEHKSAGRISVEVLDGHIQSHILGRLVDLPAKHVLILDCEVLHDVEALEESAFLLTVALPADGEQSQQHG
jgi:quercetin dioxygenase-like cupin family protein